MKLIVQRLLWPQCYASPANDTAPPCRADLVGDRECIYIARDIDKPAFAQAAEPRALPLGEAARAGFDAGDHFVVVDIRRPGMRALRDSRRLAEPCG